MKQYFAIISGISSDILSDTLSGIYTDIFLTYLSSDIVSGISSWHIFRHSFWRIFWEHCQPKLAVEVRSRRRRRRRRTRTADIESSNPHLTGGGANKENGLVNRTSPDPLPPVSPRDQSAGPAPPSLRRRSPPASLSTSRGPVRRDEASNAHELFFFSNVFLGGVDG